MVTRHSVVCCVRCGWALGDQKQCNLCDVVYLSNELLTYERLLVRGKTPCWKQVSDTCYAVKECVLGKVGMHGVSLAKDVYRHIHMFRASVGQVPVMIPLCDCADMRPHGDQLQSMNHSEYTVEDVFGPGQPLHPANWCIHVRTLCHMLSKVTSAAVLSISGTQIQENTYDILLLEDGKEGGPPIYSFAHSHDLFSRVTVSIDCHKYLVCRNSKCKRYARHCGHIQQIHRILESSGEPNEGERIWQVLGPNVRLVDKMLVLDGEDAPINQRQQQRSTATQKIVSISKHRINPTRASCQELKRKNPLAPSPWLPACDQCQITGDPCTHCVPDAEGNCDRCGSEWNKDDPVQMEWLRQRRALLLGCHAALEVSTYYRPCQGCDAQKSFDGHDVGIFNFSDSTLLLHELIFQYLDSMAHSKTTFTGFYSMLQDQYARSGCSELLRSRRVFGDAVQSFIGMLDIDYSAGFQCPACSKLSAKDQVVVFDGKTMGIMRKRMLREEENKPAASQEVLQDIKTTEYVLLPCRQSSKGLRRRMREVSDGFVFNADEKRSLLRDLRKVCPPLGEAMEVVLEEAGNGPCPVAYRRFLASISTGYPIPALIPPCLVFPQGGHAQSVIDRVCTPGQKVTVADLSSLAQTWPACADLIRQNRWSIVPPKFHSLLQKLQDLARIPGTYEDTAQQTCRDLPNEEQYTFMPHHPVCRRKNAYKGDISRKHYSACNKFTSRDRTFSPGIFSCFCPHGICWGFSIMKQYEGPGTAFDILVRRFPEAPGMVIYDNACNLSGYALKREPGHFAKTQFRIDRVHQPGHVGCHEGYNLSSYPDNCSVLGGSMNLSAMNTQVCEQAHSSLEAISTQAKFMSQGNFLQYVRYFLYRQNLAKIQKIQEE